MTNSKNDYITVIACIPIFLFLFTLILFNCTCALWGFVIAYLSIMLHELGHMAAYLIQGIRIKEFCILPIRIRFNEKLKLGLYFNYGVLGLVIPQLIIKDETNIDKYRKKTAVSLIAGVGANLILLIVCLTLNTYIDSTLTAISILINIFMIIMCLASNEICDGDINAAYFVVKNNLRYYFYLLSFIGTDDSNARYYILKKMYQEIDIKKMSNDMIKAIRIILNEELNNKVLLVDDVFLSNLFEHLSEKCKNTQMVYKEYLLINEVILILCEHNKIKQANELYSIIKDRYTSNKTIRATEEKINKMNGVK